MNLFEVTGMWWLPGRTNRRLPGILTFDSENGGRLRLIGGVLTDVSDVATWTHAGSTSAMVVTEDDLEIAGTYDLILGEAEGSRYTLEGGMETTNRGAMSGQPYYQIVRIAKIFKGAHFDSGNPSADTIYIAPCGLGSWVGHGGIEAKTNIAPNSDPRYALKAAWIPVKRIPFSDGGSLELHHRIWMPPLSPDGARIDQSFQFSIRLPSPRPIVELVELASDLQDLISIATGRPAAFDSLTFKHPRIYDPVPRNRPSLAAAFPDGRRYRPIELWTQWTASRLPTEKNIQPSDLFFTFDQMGGLAGVARWLDATRRHRSTLARVMATRYAAQGYLHDYYLGRLASLEGFDRVEHNDRAPFRARIRRCAVLAGPPIRYLVDGAVEKWIGILVKDRNYIAHHDHKGMRFDSLLAEQVRLSESAYWLYVLSLLRLAQPETALFDEVATHRRYQYLRRQLSKILTAPPDE